MESTIPLAGANRKAPAYESMPAELLDIPRWVLWRYEERDDKPTKVPYQPTGHRAKSDDPHTWYKFEDVRQVEPQYDGAGFMFSDDDDIVGIDLDKCVGDDGQLTTQAADLVRQFNSYTEFSPSGRGLHILVRGKMGRGRTIPGVEVYNTRRYFTMTGDRLADTPATIESRQKQLDSLLSGLADKAPQAADPSVKVAQGGRNNHLASKAGALRRQGFSAEAIEAALLDYNARSCEPPLSEDEVLQVARSISRYEPSAAATSFQTTDLGNAERLVHRHGDGLHYVHAWGKWFIWDGVRWAEDKTEEVRRRANETIRSVYAEASQRTDRSERQQLADHARRSESIGRLNAMVDLARSLEGIPITHESLDGDPWLLNTTNGLVDLRTGELRPHDPKALASKLVPVAFDPVADCPTWLGFLDKVMGGNQEMVNFLQRAVGYSLTGVTSEQCLFFLHGRGSNGKSTFIETVSTLLGEYWTKTPTETLMSKTHPGISNDIARLVGARLVTAQETEQGRKLAESLIKDLTGGDTVTARFLHQEYFQFKPLFKLWMYGNHKPVITGTDEGIWRRIRLVPFTVTIPDEEKDRNLPAKLLEELPGILNWAIAGCLAWQSEGLGIPLEVAEATTTYRSEMDPFSDFIGEYVVHGPQVTVKSELLYNAYKAWCLANGESTVSHKEFGRVLRERGYEAKKTGKGTFWQKIGLKEEHRNIPQVLGTHFEDMLSN